jgi:Cft2 family RNA processing exonuclease
MGMLVRDRRSRDGGNVLRMVYASGRVREVASEMVSGRWA